MTRRLEKGQPALFRRAADLKAIVGKQIVYLRTCDIDLSGRGYFFPRYGRVVEAKGRQMQLDNGQSVYCGELVELNVLGESDLTTSPS